MIMIQTRKNIFFAFFCAFLAKKQNLKTAWRHLKTDYTPPLWVPTQPQWRVGRVGTHKPRG